MKLAKNALVLLLAPVLILQACGDNKKAKNYNQKTLVDQRGLMFINTATEAGLTEVKASKLAQEISKNQRIVNFAGMMVTDHSQVGAQLTALAKDQLVTTIDTIGVAHRKAIDSLSKLTGNAFDKAYMAMMVKDHAVAVQLFSEAGNNKNSHIQKFANKTLPTLKMHQDSANAINNALK